MIQRTDEVALRMRANVQQATIDPILKATISPGTTVHMSPFQEQVRQDEVLDDRAEFVVIAFAGLGDVLDLSGIVDRHHAAQGVRCKLLDERFGESVDVLNQQVLEFVRALVRSAVGELAAGVDRWVVSFAPCDLFARSPAADRVEVVEGEAQRVDLLMAGSAGGVGRVGFEL